MSFSTFTIAGLAHSRVLALPLVLLLTLSVQARGPDPPQRIPLEPLGFQTISPRYLLEGATMVTLDYVDSQHILVTFGVSRLMHRLADCPADDEDRTVRAVLLEVPSGRELARTEWRFHDLGQYLWSLGDGRFLLRKRDVLTVISPLENLSTGNAFAEQAFLRFDRRIQAILVSASHDLLSVETIKRVAPSAPAAQTISQTISQTSQAQSPSQKPALAKGLQRRDTSPPDPATASDPAPTQIDFIRLLTPDKAGESSGNGAGKSGARPGRVAGRLDGRIHTSTAVNIPLTSEGFLRTKAASRDGVLLDFLTFTGKDIDLGDFATSCHPRPTFVSRSEFVAFGCRGDAESVDLAGFNLHGDFLWQINFTDEQAYPAFASVIPAGRFAFSRTVTATHVFGNETPSMDQLQAQEVRVIQMYNGKQLLKVVTSPIQRAGQNFTLSPDGLALAVIHDNQAAKGELVTHQTSIEIYKLPALSEKDRAQIKLEAAMAPEPSYVPMRFSADEIKAALAAKPGAEAGSPGSMPSPQPAPGAAGSVDARIAGDSAPAATPAPATGATGAIRSSDPPPDCANLKDTASAACQAVASPKTAATGDSAAGADTQPEKRRKAPTLYDPGTEAPGAPAPQ